LIGSVRQFLCFSVKFEMPTVVRNKMTLTEAQNQSRIKVYIVEMNRTRSTSRIIPYSEIYRERTGIMETPAEHLQKAVEDEKRRSP